MQTCGHSRVKTARKLLFIQKCPHFCQKLSASIACMLATFSMSEFDYSIYSTFIKRIGISGSNILSALIKQTFIFFFSLKKQIEVI